MCGIVGYAGRGKCAAKCVYEGLLRLEYRGYDSAGISVLDGGKITTVKRSGRVCQLESAAGGMGGGIAIGHTRWATHGAPSDINAHPHNYGAFSVVHNGIIENYAELKEELAEGGRLCVSETDSEVIALLIDSLYSGDALAAVAAAAARLKGSFALAVLCRDFEGFIAVRHKSPVAIGECDGAFFAASDVPALPAEAENVYFLEDGDIAAVTYDGIAFYDFGLNAQRRESCRIPRGQFTADKGGYVHYMAKEIEEDARTIRDTAEAFLRSADADALGSLLTSSDEIIITGCGTAYNSGLIARRYFESALGRPVTVEIASELRYYPPPVGKNTLVIAISQSGETADTVEAVHKLRESGASVIAVTNCGYSAITRIAHAVVPVCAGAEICVAATKSYMGQLAALYLISRCTGDVRAAAKELTDVAEMIPSVISDDANADCFSDMCAESFAVFFLGRGADYDAAVEASLKLKEVSYIFSDAYPSGELKHGTLALVDESTLSVFIICQPETANKCLSAVHEVLCRGGRAAVLTSVPEAAEELGKYLSVWKLPTVSPRLAPFLSAAALQRVAYLTAVRLGRNPDKPRNLAKSVTVE